MFSRTEMEGARQEPEVIDLDREIKEIDLRIIRTVEEVLDRTQGHLRRLLMAQVQLVVGHSIRT